MWTKSLLTVRTRAASKEDTHQLHAQVLPRLMMVHKFEGAAAQGRGRLAIGT